MITISSYYGNNPASEGNAKKVSIAGTSFFFSYDTLVAVRDMNGLKVLKNTFSTTTAKHLNAIDGGSKEAKASRMNDDEFEAYVSQLQIASVLKSAFN